MAVEKFDKGRRSFLQAAAATTLLAGAGTVLSTSCAKESEAQSSVKPSGNYQGLSSFNPLQ